MLALPTNENSCQLFGTSAIELGNRQQRLCLMLKYSTSINCAIERIRLCYRADVLFVKTSNFGLAFNPFRNPQHIIAQRLVPRAKIFHFLYPWLLGFPQGSAGCHPVKEILFVICYRSITLLTTPKNLTFFSFFA